MVHSMMLNGVPQKQVVKLRIWWVLGAINSCCLLTIHMVICMILNNEVFYNESSILMLGINQYVVDLLFSLLVCVKMLERRLQS